MPLRKFNFQSIFRTLAIFLVINSHLDGFYRNSFLASGGSLGNTMFFFISGFSLATQIHIKSLRKLFSFETISWLILRFKRIYFPLWFYLFIFSLINIFLYSIDFKFTLSHSLNSIIYPTDFWFIGELVLLYFLTPLESLLKNYKLKKFLYIFLIAIYVYEYIFNLSLKSDGLFVEYTQLRYIFYALVYFSANDVIQFFFKEDNKIDKSYVIKCLSTFLILLIASILIKLNLSNIIIYKSQILYPLLIFLICINLYHICLIVSFYEKNISKSIKYTLSKISSLTYDIYLFECFHIELLNKLREEFVDIHIAQFPIIKLFLIIFIPFNFIYIMYISSYFNFIKQTFGNKSSNFLKNIKN